MITILIITALTITTAILILIVEVTIGNEGANWSRGNDVGFWIQ